MKDTENKFLSITIPDSLGFVTLTGSHEAILDLTVELIAASEYYHMRDLKALEKVIDNQLDIITTELNKQEEKEHE